MINYNEHENTCVKKKNRSQKYDVNRPTSIYGLAYTNKHKKCLSMMILICIKGFLHYKTILCHKAALDV